MTPSWEEWVKQAEYDLNVSEQILKNNLPAHPTFTIHLALEKILKACYIHKTTKILQRPTFFYFLPEHELLPYLMMVRISWKNWKAWE